MMSVNTSKQLSSEALLLRVISNDMQSSPIIANRVLIQVSFEFLLDHSEFLLHSGRVKGVISLADSGRHSFSRYDLDSAMRIVDKTKHFHLLSAWANHKVLC